MKLATLSPAPLAFALVSANAQYGGGSHDKWEPAGPGDFRGPCPMMNTLANHAFLPHDGKNITKENAIDALSRGLNFNTSLAALMFEMAIVANPEPNATFFTLDHLNRHNVLEHDASMSRTDAFFGNNHVFNQTVFDGTRAYWTGAILDADMLANGKLARQIESKAFNPDYTFTAATEQFSLGEVGAPIVAFGDMQAATVNRTLVEYFFENERFPSELGWTLRQGVVSEDDILKVTQMIAQAASLITSSGEAPAARRRDLHSGLVRKA